MHHPEQPDNLSKARMLLATRRFIKLDEWLLSQMRGWQNQTDTHSDYGLLMHPGSLFAANESTQYRLQLLDDWAAQCPNSYHVQVLIGMLWHEQAWVIRQSHTGEEIADHQWLGAQLCCDYAVMAFLAAIERHPRPTHAFRHLMNLSGGFGEPYWLRALFAGDIPKPLHEQFNIENSQVWQDGAQHLYVLGVEPLTHWPQQLPVALQHTRRGNEEALDYWLRMAMAVRHNDVGSMESYLLFHSTYWGGSAQQQQEIIDSPLCAEFSEQERNQFRATAMLDAIKSDIADRQSEQAILLQQQLEHLLTQPLESATRIRLLDQAGAAVAYWQDDDLAGLALYADLFNVSPQAMPGHLSSLFISRVVLANGNQDGLPVLTTLLTRAIAQCDNALLTAFAAAAIHYGLYGLAKQPELSAGLMDCAWSLMYQEGTKPSTEKDLLTLAHDMALNDDIDAAHFLMVEMARRGSALHSHELYFFYRNLWYQDVPEALQSDSNALDCVLSAARSGLVPAMFNCANALREGFAGEADYAQAMQWYLRAIDGCHLQADYWRASCALDLGPEQDKRLAVEQWLPAIVANIEHPERAEAAYTLGMAYMQGTGTSKNRYYSWQFMQFVLELSPESTAAQEALAVLEGSLRSRMSLWQDKRKVDGHDIVTQYRQTPDSETPLPPI